MFCTKPLILNQNVQNILINLYVAKNTFLIDKKQMLLLILYLINFFATYLYVLHETSHIYMQKLTLD